MDVRTPPIRCGIFEVDVASGESRKDGERIRLQEQPFQTLVALLERPGEVLTREELQKRLWPADIVVDFDRGLNKAINRLREALGDDAEDPRFIETLPQRGYRFIGQVETSPAGIARPQPRQVPASHADVYSPSAAGWPPWQVSLWGSAFGGPPRDGLNRSRCCHSKTCRATLGRSTFPMG